MQNFGRPYSATTVREFWSRWHISLSSWFKDYLYIPLGGNRVSLPRNLLNLFIVFAVSGLWHGASWTFVIWGALHGIYQIVGKLTAKPRARFIAMLGFTEKSLPVLIFRRINTFALVTFAWLLFRANTISDALLLISRIFTSIGISDALHSMGMTPTLALITVFAIALMVIFDRIAKYDGKEVARGSGVLVNRGAFVYIIFVILFAWCLLLSKDMISNFIYFRF